MENFEKMWKTTKRRFNEMEKALIDLYMNFLREVAKIYLARGRKVYFRENRHTHWGEGGFGVLYIEGEENAPDLFSDYVCEVQFFKDLNEVSEFLKQDLIQVRENNLHSIRYETETRAL